MSRDATADDEMAPLVGTHWPGDPVDDARVLAAMEAALLGRPSALPHVSRYRLGAKLGEGGFGVVYSAFDPELERDVAIKLLDATAAEDADAKALRRALSSEARALARVHHPNVVAVHDVGTYELTTPGHRGERELRGVFIVMERIDGPTLAHWLDAGGHAPGEVLDVFLAAGRGLAAAHAAGLVHRDFKASNVLMDPSGSPRVVDFGLARATPEPADRPRSAGTQAPATSSGDAEAAGTPSHMPPEQLAGEVVDARADQYAFCVALALALTGKSPFEGASIEALVSAKRAGAPAEALRRRLPRRVAAVLIRGLAPEAAGRYASMDALLRELAVASRARQPWRGAIAGAGIAAAVAVPLLWGRAAAGDPVCAEDASALAWDAEAAAGMQAAFVTADAELGAAAWARVQPRLDAWVDRWTAARDASCEATLVRREATPETMGARMLCLDRGTRTFAAVRRVLSSMERATLEHAPEIVVQLPDPDACLAPSVQADSSAGDPQVMLRIEEQLAEAMAHDAGGHEDRARAGYEAVVVEAGAAGLPDLEVRALIRLSALNRELPAAERAAWRALEVAEGTDDEALAIAAGTAVVEVCWSLRKLEHADRMAQVIAAKLRKRGIPDLLPADFAMAVGSLRYGQGRFDDPRVRRVARAHPGGRQRARVAVGHRPQPPAPPLPRSIARESGDAARERRRPGRTGIGERAPRRP